MQSLTNLANWFVNFSEQNYVWIARIALFITFFYFGLLKLIGASPAGDLAIGFATKMGMGGLANELYLALAVVECLIGVLFLIPKLTLLVVPLMLGHMIMVSAPILLYPEAVWTEPFVPNLEGQYIIKNVALVALALGVVASLKTKKSA